MAFLRCGFCGEVNKSREIDEKTVVFSVCLRFLRGVFRVVLRKMSKNGEKLRKTVVCCKIIKNKLKNFHYLSKNTCN